MKDSIVAARRNADLQTLQINAGHVPTKQIEEAREKSQFLNIDYWRVRMAVCSQDYALGDCTDVRKDENIKIGRCGRRFQSASAKSQRRFVSKYGGEEVLRFDAITISFQP